jgi:hypothetical protein
VGFATDLRERKREEEALRQALPRDQAEANGMVAMAVLQPHDSESPKPWDSTRELLVRPPLPRTKSRLSQASP